MPRQGLGTDKGWKCWKNILKVRFILRAVGSHGRILSEGGAQLGLEMRKNFLGLVLLEPTGHGREMPAG